jgi:ABC-type glycerol-3-phosphate transport system substrate-binding protein
MRFITKILILVFISIFSFSTINCGKKEEIPEGKTVIKVAYWGSPEEVEIIKATINEWQKDHPDIYVKLEHTPGSDYVNKLLTRIAGGAPPDVAFMEVNIFVTFSEKNVFLDLRPLIENDPEFSLDDFFPEVVDRFRVNGGIYAIPRDTAPFACVYYNKNLFDQAGIPYPTDDWDWYNLLDKAQKLTKTDEQGRIIQYGFYAWAWQNFVYFNGGKVVDNVKNPTKCLLNQPRAIEGLQMFQDLFLKYKVSPTPTAMSNMGMGSNQMFMTGRLAMYASGIWETPVLRKITSFDWDIVMFPKGPKGKRGFGTGGSGYTILKATKHPKEAWEVVKALAADKGQIMLAETGLAQPANRKIAEGPYWAGSNKKPLNKGMLNEAVKYVTYDPFHPRWREIQDLYIYPQMDLLYNGDIDAKEFVNRITPDINRILRSASE